MSQPCQSEVLDLNILGGQLLDLKVGDNASLIELMPE